EDAAASPNEHQRSRSRISSAIHRPRRPTQAGTLRLRSSSLRWRVDAQFHPRKAFHAAARAAVRERALRWTAASLHLPPKRDPNIRRYGQHCVACPQAPRVARGDRAHFGASHLFATADLRAPAHTASMMLALETNSLARSTAFAAPPRLADPGALRPHRG